MNTPRTVLRARDNEVVIGPDRPFVIVGERINPTNRARLASTVEAHDMSIVQRDALAQVEAGAHVLDVNVGTAFGDEVEIMPLAVRAVLEVVDVPLSIDSPNPAAVAAGLAAYIDVCGPSGKPLLNSTSGEEERLSQVLPLAAEYGAAVIGLAHGEGGIPESAEGRFEAAETIVARAEEAGLAREDVVIDGLTLTVGANYRSASCTMETTERVARELGVNTISGASNVSFGLPGRLDINVAFLAMMIARGLNAAITNPLHREIGKTVAAADLLMARDENALGWIRSYRESAEVA